MPFYASIVDLYDEIFPLSPDEVSFTLKFIQEQAPHLLLDIGCGTGGLAAALAERVGRVEAFDFDEQMVACAKKLHPLPNVSFKQGDMRCLDKLYPDQSFNLITCYGNTLVHVHQEEVRPVLVAIKKHLTQGGLFLGQLLNYEHIFDKNVMELPLIETEKFSFTRKYDLQSNTEITFRTLLEIKDSGQIIANEIPLYPIIKEDLIQMLYEAGFKKINFYSNFKGEAHHGSHLPLIFQAA